VNDLSTLIDRYLAAYGDPDKTRRTLAVSGELIDPPLTATGHAQIVAQSDALLSQFPGHRFRRSSGVDAHHGFARYAWQLISPADVVVLEGFDVAQTNDQGKLQRVVGFFGPLPTLDSLG
jgi:hypothetical protein